MSEASSVNRVLTYCIDCLSPDPDVLFDETEEYAAWEESPTDYAMSYEQAIAIQDSLLKLLKDDPLSVEEALDYDREAVWGSED